MLFPLPRNFLVILARQTLTATEAVPPFPRMKKPLVILIDPKKASERCLKQRPVSREKAINSILAQNGKSTSLPAAKVS